MRRAGSPAERARTAVTARVRTAVRRVAAAHSVDLEFEERGEERAGRTGRVRYCRELVRDDIRGGA